MKKVEYSFGGGTGDVFLSMKTKKIYFCYLENDRAEMHGNYGGKQYYSSRSGASGAGFVFADDLFKIEGTYRANITYLSEAWPTEIFGVKIMLPTEGLDANHRPAVALLDGVLVFMTSPEEIVSILTGAIPGEDLKKVSYRYLNHNGEISKFEIGWVGWNCYAPRDGRPHNLPYPFESFVSTMGLVKKVPQEGNLHRMDFPADSDWETVSFWDLPGEIEKRPVSIFDGYKQSFIERKMSLTKSEIGLVRLGSFGLPVEKIDGELFPQDQQRSFRSGWNTQGFGAYHFAYKRVGDNGTKVYAVLEVVPGQVSEKYSVLGESSMEYELLIENVIEWFNHPIEYWVEKMKVELTKKIRSEFLNSTRWDSRRQMAKVRELLMANPEIKFCIQDSLDTGNCEPGTKEWMARFDITEPQTGKQLLEHKKFEEMLGNARFRAVILHKLYEEVITTTGRVRNFEDIEEED